MAQKKFSMELSRIAHILIGGVEIEEYNRIKKFAARYYSPLVVIMMVFPPLEILPLALFITFWMLILYMIYTVLFTVTCVLATDDFVVWSEIIHHTLLIYLAIFINTVILLRKKDLILLTAQLLDGVYTYDEGLVDPIFKKVDDECNKQMYKMFFVPGLIIFVTGSTIGIKPMLDYMMDVTPHPSLVSNNISFNSLVPVYYPFNDTGTTVFMSNGFLLAFAFLVASTIIAADIIFIRSATRIVREMRVLIESIYLIEKRARRTYLRRFGQKPPKRNTQQYGQYEDCVEDCFKENIKHHHEILKFYEHFSAVASPAIGGGFFICTIVMGLGMIILNMKDVNTGDLVAFSGLTIAELLNAFMISWNSELIGELNYELFNAVYGVKWYKWRKSIKTTVISFMDGTREPLFLNAFGLTKINMETFGSMVNTSYSFLNLVKVSESFEDTGRKN